MNGLFGPTNGPIEIVEFGLFWLMLLSFLAMGPWKEARISAISPPLLRISLAKAQNLAIGRIFPEGDERHRLSVAWGDGEMRPDRPV
jgi:hypothetical protein